MIKSAKGAILAGSLLFLFPIFSFSETFDAERAYRYLLQQCNLGTREPNSSGHRAMKEYLERFLKEKKGAYRRVDFTYADTVRHKTLALTNFHISFKGKSKKTHLFCAHWDCRPWADRDPDFRNRSLPIPGANDGASGTAILMELCNLLSSTPADKSVELAFFDGEDYGSGNMPEAWCLGFKYFARNVLSETYAYAVLIDMVGDKNLAIKREPQSLACAPWLISKVWALAKEQGAAGFLDKT